MRAFPVSLNPPTTVQAIATAESRRGYVTLA
jgi:hypothetical protein